MLGSKIVSEYADGTNKDTSFGLNEAFGDWKCNLKNNLDCDKLAAVSYWRCPVIYLMIVA